jgi:hypothetical protein
VALEEAVGGRSLVEGHLPPLVGAKLQVTIRTRQFDVLACAASARRTCLVTRDLSCTTVGWEPSFGGGLGGATSSVPSHGRVMRRTLLTELSRRSENDAQREDIETLRFGGGGALEGGRPSNATGGVDRRRRA